MRLLPFRTHRVCLPVAHTYIYVRVCAGESIGSSGSGGSSTIPINRMPFVHRERNVSPTWDSDNNNNYFEYYISLLSYNEIHPYHAHHMHIYIYGWRAPETARPNQFIQNLIYHHMQYDYGILFLLRVTHRNVYRTRYHVNEFSHNTIAIESYVNACVCAKFS